MIFNGEDRDKDDKKSTDSDESVLFCYGLLWAYSNVLRLMVGPKKRALAKSFWVPYQ